MFMAVLSMALLAMELSAQRGGHGGMAMGGARGGFIMHGGGMSGSRTVHGSGYSENTGHITIITVTVLIIPATIGIFRYGYPYNAPA